MIQLRVLNYQDTSYSYEQQSLQLQIDSIANRNGLCPIEMGYLNNQISALNTQRAILDIQEAYYNGAATDGDQQAYAQTYFGDLKAKIPTQDGELVQQQNYLNVKKQELGQQYSEQVAQKNLLNSQRSNIGTRPSDGSIRGKRQRYEDQRVYGKVRIRQLREPYQKDDRGRRFITRVYIYLQYGCEARNRKHSGGRNHGQTAVGQAGAE